MFLTRLAQQYPPTMADYAGALLHESLLPKNKVVAAGGQVPNALRCHDCGNPMASKAAEFSGEVPFKFGTVGLPSPIHFSMSWQHILDVRARLLQGLLQGDRLLRHRGLGERLAQSLGP